MSGSDDFLIDVMMANGLVTEKQVRKARDEADKNNLSVIDTLESLEYVTENDVMMLMASEYGMETFDFTGYKIPTEVIASMPAEVARRYQVVPVRREDGLLTVAMHDPSDIETLDSLRYILDCDIEGVVSPRSQIHEALNYHYGSIEESVEQFIEDITEGVVEIGEVSQGGLGMDDADDADEDAPIIRLVSLVILEAFRTRTSDIHMEPMEKRYRVRYRIDGVLHEVENPPKYLQNNITSRMKIMARMDISEHRVPQDGRIMISAMGRDLDLRVSDIPTTHGESIVSRILDKTSVMIGIAELGFLEDDEQVINRILSFPDGIFLVTGPTGSGKTTSLYAFLNTLNEPSTKIITCENPVEYELSGINQVQINHEIGLDFGHALRAMLRQAPNIIMVGEIRDLETAEIAINAALTGHLVFSTLHTNDAPSAVTRLLDMGIKPFLVASAVRAIMAQRLVRRVCSNCAVEIKATEAEAKALGLSIDYFESGTLKRGKGCSSCSNGYRGRIGIFEIFMIDESIQRLVYEQVSAGHIRSRARELGMRTLREDGLRKIMIGMTTLEEVVRVTAADDYN